MQPIFLNWNASAFVILDKMGAMDGEAAGERVPAIEYSRDIGRNANWIASNVVGYVRHITPTEHGTCGQQILTAKGEHIAFADTLEAAECWIMATAYRLEAERLNRVANPPRSPFARA